MANEKETNNPEELNEELQDKKAANKSAKSSAAERVAKKNAKSESISREDQKVTAKSTKAALDKEEKVMFIIPRAIGEATGSTHEVQINGHVMRIKKGEAVELPKSVAFMLADHFNIVMSAGEEISLGRDQDGLAEALN